MNSCLALFAYGVSELTCNRTSYSNEKGAGLERAGCALVFFSTNNNYDWEHGQGPLLQVPPGVWTLPLQLKRGTVLTSTKPGSQLISLMVKQQSCGMANLPDGRLSAQLRSNGTDGILRRLIRSIFFREVD